MKRIIFMFISVIMLCFVFVYGVSAAQYMGGKAVTDGGNLNLRQSPSQNSAVTGSIKNGSIFTLREKKGNWYFAEYEKGKTAYLSADYVKSYPKTIDATVKISSGRLNVRAGADTAYKIQDKLNDGDRVVVIKSNGKWCRILYHGNKIGYVSRPYLARTSEVNSYTSVRLDVVSFKQTDSRWKSYPIGTTGGTIGTIGCTTTALSMIESYHTGKTVTPPMMAKKLSYSASGSLYWPSTHSVSTVGDDYLSVIYKLLKQGKPVVFGMKTGKGNQHWVTVYGFEGGNELTPSRFLINDPGSDTRINLQQVLNSYPYAYKICYKK